MNERVSGAQARASEVPPDEKDLLERWLTVQHAEVAKSGLSLLSERDGARDGLIDELRAMVRDHYVAPEVTAKRLAELGATETAALLREHVPISKKARSGDLGEILATEFVERRLGYRVPVRRLRWKDGRNMALRGNDIVAVAPGAKGRLQFLKGESKSRALLTTAAVTEAANVLDRDQGRPSRHSVLFVAGRLREQGNDELAKAMEQAVLQSFRGHPVEHLLFALTGSDPKSILSAHLIARAKKKHRRRAAGVRIHDHGAFIAHLFSGL